MTREEKRRIDLAEAIAEKLLKVAGRGVDGLPPAYAVELDIDRNDGRLLVLLKFLKDDWNPDGQGG